MPIGDYIKWQHFDRYEPIGITAALDMLFARLMQCIAACNGVKHTAVEDFLTFAPTQKIKEERILQRLRNMGFKETK